MEESPAQRRREEGARAFDKSLDDATKKGPAADRDWAKACLWAKRNAGNNGLLPAFDEYGDDKYTVRQGIKAACWGYEDSAAALLLQRGILNRLDRNRTLLFVCIGLLIYIAFRVS